LAQPFGYGWAGSASPCRGGASAATPGRGNVSVISQGAERDVLLEGRSRMGRLDSTGSFKSFQGELGLPNSFKCRPFSNARLRSNLPTKEDQANDSSYYRMAWFFYPAHNEYLDVHSFNN